MEKQELAKTRRRLKALHKELAALGPVMRGSVVIIAMRNKPPYLNKKTQLIDLGKKREDRAVQRQLQTAA